MNKPIIKKTTHFFLGTKEDHIKYWTSIQKKVYEDMRKAAANGTK